MLNGTLTSPPSTDIQWTESRCHHHQVQRQVDGKMTKEENEGDDENDDIIFAMFADPDPYQTFEYTFFVKRTLPTTPTRRIASSSIICSDSTKQEHDQTQQVKIQLHGLKQENGQTLHSTGLTIWRATKWMCDYMIQNASIVRGKRVLELGAGLGLCGILACHLQASEVLLTDGDINVLQYLRQNVRNNAPCHNDAKEHDVCSRASSDNITTTTTTGCCCCAQLIWGQQYAAQFQTIYPGQWNVILAADVIYEPEIIQPLWETVDALLSKHPAEDKSTFVLSYAPRNVPLELVLKGAASFGFEWTASTETAQPEGIFIFTRNEN